MLNQCKCGRIARNFTNKPLTYTCTCGESVYLGPKGDFTLPPCNKQPTRQRLPIFYKLIAKYRQPQDIGAGDTIEHAAEKYGIDKVARLLKRIGIDCGCSNRKDWYNERYKYKD